MFVEHISYMINESANLECQYALAELGRVLLISDGTFDGIEGRARTKIWEAIAPHSQFLLRLS